MKSGQLIEYNFIYFFSKIMQKMWQGEQFLFRFFKELYIRQKQVVCSLISIYFDSPQLDIQSKQTI